MLAVLVKRELEVIIIPIVITVTITTTDGGLTRPLLCFCFTRMAVITTGLRFVMGSCLSCMLIRRHGHRLCMGYITLLLLCLKFLDHWVEC